jgi:hypothetical protein
MKIHPLLSVLELSLLVELPQEVGELLLSINSCPVVIIENAFN